MRILKFGIIFIILSSGALAAENAIDLAVGELSKAEGVGKDWFEEVSIRKAGDKVILKFTRSLGEGGDEICTSTYRKSGVLMELDCNSEYVAHSMGPENKQFKTHLKREFDQSGKLVQVSGHRLAVRLDNKKRVEDRELRSMSDPVVDDSMHPVKKLSPAILSAATP